MSSFASELWDQVTPVIKYSQERRKQIDAFIDVLNQRISSQQNYAKGVEEAAKMADRIRQGQQSASSLAFSCFKFDCVNRGAQARTFAKCLREEIMIPLKDLLQEQNQQTKQLEKKYKKLQKQFNQYQSQITKIRNKFMQEYKEKQETIITNQILIQSSRTPKYKRVKILMKSNDIMKNLAEYQATHQSLVKKYNLFLNEYYAEVQKLLNVYQNHQQVRIARQQQNIMKTLIFGTSMMKNYEYDIVTITNQIEKTKQVNDIQNFIELYKTGQPKLGQKSSQIQKDFLAQSLIRINNKSFQKGIMLLMNKELKVYIEKVFKGEQSKCNLFSQNILEEFRTLFRILASTWKGEALQLEQIQKIKELLQDQTNRLMLYLYLQQHLLTSNVSLTESGYEQMIFMIVQVLNICQISKDVFVARKIINLTFSFYTLKSDQKHYLHFGLNDFQLFKQPDFWKSTIFESIQQQLFIQLNNKSEEQFEMRQLSLIVGLLAMYCHQMILLGVSSKTVRQMIGYFCRLYNIPEDRNRDLSKTVTLSIKKYNELFSAAQTTISVESNPGDRRWSLDQIKPEEEPQQNSNPFKNKNQLEKKYSLDLPQHRQVQSQKNEITDQNV